MIREIMMITLTLYKLPPNLVTPRVGWSAGAFEGPLCLRKQLFLKRIEQRSCGFTFHAVIEAAVVELTSHWFQPWC